MKITLRKEDAPPSRFDEERHGQHGPAAVALARFVAPQKGRPSRRDGSFLARVPLLTKRATARQPRVGSPLKRGGPLARAAVAALARFAAPRVGCVPRRIKLFGRDLAGAIQLSALSASVFLLLGSGPNLEAFYDVAGGEVILDTRLTGGYDSNLFGRADSDDDFFVSLAPTLSWLRSAGLSNLNASAGVNVTRYNEFSGQNFEDYFGRFSAGFPIPGESDLSGGVNIGYARRTRLDEVIFDRITTDIFNAGINAAYQLRPATRLTSSYGYTDSRTGDFKTVTNAGNLGIGFTELYRNLDLSFNYRIRHSQLDRPGQSRDSLDHAFGINLSGPLLPEQWLPRVTTTFSLGYDNTLPTAEEDRTRRRIVGSVGANWQARERTTVGLSVSRDLDLSPDQRNVESTNVNLNVGQTFTVKISGNAYVGYSWRHFPDADRRQETFRAGTGLNYNFNRNWNAGTNYSYTKNITDEAIREFDRHLITLFTSYIF